jgi:hypothetical protein
MLREYSDIRELIKEKLQKEEDPSTKLLIDELKSIKGRRYFTRSEFLKMCNWKSPRPRKHYEANDHKLLRRVSEEVFATESEEQKMELLTSLKGVSIAVGSAILMLSDPVNYGVIDIRVWQILYLYNQVLKKPTGRALSNLDWQTFLVNMRSLAKELNLDVRTIERTLFQSHKEIQVGTLYG